MSYNPTVASIITAKLKNVKDIRGTFYLPDCNQKDVEDTVNYLHAKYPAVINETELSYDGLADVTYDLSFSKLSADHQ